MATAGGGTAESVRHRLLQYCRPLSAVPATVAIGFTFGPHTDRRFNTCLRAVHMETSLMSCPDCGELCVVSTTEAGEPYRAGSCDCPGCGERDLCEVEDSMDERIPTA